MKRRKTTSGELNGVEFEIGSRLCVTWLDAHNLPDGWQHITELKFTRTEVVTLGHFVAIEEDQLWLACDWCEEDEMANTVVGIPVGMIVKVKVLDNG